MRSPLGGRLPRCYVPFEKDLRKREIFVFFRILLLLIHSKLLNIKPLNVYIDDFFKKTFASQKLS